MVSDKKLANAVGGKTARACDSCIKKRARWYCAADDAFLCQACDASVHSANPLARRHKRVRLKIASFKSCDEFHLENLLPTWHPGFTKKARTPRHGKHNRTPKAEESVRNPLPFVPDMGAEENSNEDNEEQLLYRVPIFDPFAAELSRSGNSNEATRDVFGGESKAVVNACGHGVNSLNEFLPSDMDLADFAADVESLLGKGLDEESFDMEGLGLVDFKESDQMEGSLGKVKVEEEEGMEAVMRNHLDMETDPMREPFEFRFDYEEEDKEAEAEEKVVQKDKEEYREIDVKKKKKILLRLDYEGVITAWANQKSPWTTGDRPELDPTDCWPDCMGGCGTVHHSYGDIGVIGAHTAMLDGGREARVSRYREKRRTRLFSKKIRYEVRKLNAEKRPRMKGRFVKRANFAGPSFPLLIK
ncbi:zinc finger protein CONSTANS-LIKE 16-like [Cornus florida]|uniref:zinc finger protein CONSTANS-LIKE 16-like n=1 Tax=Cornus florida TaxID=4283 RepID=UPI00289F0C04|nr:zinc finger protein CONSTANS-LIKE 16-like [Cornus florida]